MKLIQRWQILLALALIVLSIMIYLIHWAIFHDPHHIFIYMVGDLAFVPIEVLLVTIIVHRLLSERERRSRLQKLNMVIGVFFSEAGTELLARFSDFDPKLEDIKQNMVCCTEWTEKDFAELSRTLKHYDFDVDIQKVDIVDLRDFLVSRRDHLLRLLENPNLLEHETFTLLLQAVFHLTEELANRKDLAQLPQNDLIHLEGDIKRAYVLLVNEWVDYMRHLKNNYPYLFSLAMRTNPFDQSASVIIK